MANLIFIPRSRRLPDQHGIIPHEPGAAKAPRLALEERAGFHGTITPARRTFQRVTSEAAPQRRNAAP